MEDSSFFMQWAMNTLDQHPPAGATYAAGGGDGGVETSAAAAFPSLQALRSASHRDLTVQVDHLASSWSSSDSPGAGAMDHDAAAAWSPHTAQARTTAAVNRPMSWNFGAASAQPTPDIELPAASAARGKKVLRRWSRRWNRTHEHTQLQYQQVTKCIEIAVSCMNQDLKDRPFIWNIIRKLSDIGSTSHANESAVDNVNSNAPGNLKGTISSDKFFLALFPQISPYYQEDMLLIELLELHFSFEINKQISRSLQLINGTGSYIAVNIETPQHFWIQPNKGIVPPQFKCTVTVIMQQEKALQDMKHDDEFILESTKVKDGLRAEYITKDMFKEEVGKVVDKVNLTVVYKSMQSQDLDRLATEHLNRSAEPVSKENRQTQITTVEEEKMEKGRSEIQNCFGEVINNYKLDKMARYVGKPKTQEDRAREAWNLVNEEDKDAKASKYVDALKATYGTGQSTLCLVYNATGDTIYLVAEHDWYGYIGSAPYPTEIGNGQWAAFHHVHQSGDPSGSVAAVVYRGKNTDDQDQDYLLAWSTPWGFWYRNKAYCEIGGVDYFKTRWGNTYEKLINSDYSSNVKSNGCEIEAKIGAGDSPKYTARITS